MCKIRTVAPIGLFLASLVYAKEAQKKAKQGNTKNEEYNDEMRYISTNSENTFEIEKNADKSTFFVYYF